jgi:phosphoglycolate phosphatase
MKPILLFDIDGTLLHIRRDFLLEVIHQILKEFKFSDEILQNQSFAGRTDRDIFSELVGEYDSGKNLYDEVKTSYLSLMSEQLKPAHVELLPHAAEVVQQAAEMGIPTGLCTGNFKEVAYKKIEAAGMNGSFTFGGFGCRHADRIHLPGEASADYQKVYGSHAPPHRFVVIGDTPNDIRSAQYFGARSIGVTTGGFSSSELQQGGPDAVMTGLHELTGWLEEKW